MIISRFLYIIYNISWIYITYIIFTSASKQKSQNKNKIKIDNNRVKYIKYNYITNKDTVWNHGEVAWETGWEKEKTELQTQPLFIVEYEYHYSSLPLEVKTQDKCDETIQNQQIYINASFFGFLKIFYEEFLRRDNFIIQFENIEQSLYNSVFLLLSLVMNVGYKQSKKREIIALSSNSNNNNKNNDSSYLNKYMQIKKNSMSFFLVVFYIFIKNVGIAE